MHCGGKLESHVGRMIKAISTLLVFVVTAHTTKARETAIGGNTDALTEKPYK